jgi:hypothetical protein
VRVTQKTLEGLNRKQSIKKLKEIMEENELTPNMSVKQVEQYKEKRAREKEMEELDPSLIIDAKAKTRVTRQATKTVKPKSYNTSDFDTIMKEAIKKGVIDSDEEGESSEVGEKSEENEKGKKKEKKAKKEKDENSANSAVEESEDEEEGEESEFEGSSEHNDD